MLAAAADCFRQSKLLLAKKHLSNLLVIAVPDSDCRGVPVAAVKLLVETFASELSKHQILDLAPGCFLGRGMAGAFVEPNCWWVVPGRHFGDFAAAAAAADILLPRVPTVHAAVPDSWQREPTTVLQGCYYSPAFPRTVASEVVEDSCPCFQPPEEPLDLWVVVADQHHQMRQSVPSTVAGDLLPPGALPDPRLRQLKYSESCQCLEVGQLQKDSPAAWRKDPEEHC